MKFKRVLFIQLKMLGDILMLTPAIRAFKKKYPDVILDVAVETPGSELLRYNPHVDNVITLTTRRWYDFGGQFEFINKIRKNKYDVVIDFLGNPRSSHYTFLSGAPVRVGYNDAQYRYAYTNTYGRESDYSASSKVKFIDFLGVKNDDLDLEFYLPDNIELPDSIKKLDLLKAVAISPVSLRHFNIWPIENYARVAEYLYHKFDLYPVVIVGPGEQAYLDNFQKVATCPYQPLYIDKLYLLGEALKKCRLYIGNDNGPKHMAVALGLPTYVIFSHNRDPFNWTFPDPVRHRFAGGKNRPDCAPIGEIKFEDVIDKISQMISELRIADPEKAADINIRE